MFKCYLATPKNVRRSFQTSVFDKRKAPFQHSIKQGTKKRRSGDIFLSTRFSIDLLSTSYRFFSLRNCYVTCCLRFHLIIAIIKKQTVYRRNVSNVRTYKRNRNAVRPFSICRFKNWSNFVSFNLLEGDTSDCATWVPPLAWKDAAGSLVANVPRHRRVVSITRG